MDGWQARTLPLSQGSEMVIILKVNENSGLLSGAGSNLEFSL